MESKSINEKVSSPEGMGSGFKGEGAMGMAPPDLNLSAGDAGGDSPSFPASSLQLSEDLDARQVSLMGKVAQLKQNEATVMARTQELEASSAMQFNVGQGTLQLNLLDDAKGIVGDGIAALKEKFGDLSSALGISLPSTPYEALQAIIRAFNHPVFGQFKSFIPDWIEKALDQILALYELLKNALEKATQVVAEIKAWFQIRINETEARAREELARRGVPDSHLEGIWDYLQPMLETLANSWWEGVRAGVWDMIWPIPGVWEDIQGAMNNLVVAGGHLWNLDFQLYTDSMVDIWQNVNTAATRLYGWASLVMVVGGAALGSLAGGVGAIPGAAAGAQTAASVGAGLLASTIAADGAELVRSFEGLSSVDNARQNPDVAVQNEIYYEKIASNVLSLSVLGSMTVVAAVAARIGKAIVGRVKATFQRPSRANTTNSNGQTPAQATGNTGQATLRQYTGNRYTPGPRDPNLTRGIKFKTKKSTTMVSEWRRVIKKSDMWQLRDAFLGDGYVKVDGGKWVSIDGQRLFRSVPDDYLGVHGMGKPVVPGQPHCHLEFLRKTPSGNYVVTKNVHIPLEP